MAMGPRVILPFRDNARFDRVVQDISEDSVKLAFYIGGCVRWQPAIRRAGVLRHFPVPISTAGFRAGPVGIWL